MKVVVYSYWFLFYTKQNRRQDHLLKTARTEDLRREKLGRAEHGREL